MDEQKLEDLIKKFKESETVKALDRYFSEKSMMEILGVDRDENTHSNFLAWLFENEVTGKEACQLLIELLNKKYVALTDETKKGFKAIECLNNMNINKIKVIREEYVSDRYQKNGDKIKLSGDDDGEIITGRSDILIVINEGEENAAYIMIENKIDSEEICEWDSNKNTPKEKTKKEDETEEEQVEEKKKYTPGINSLWQTQFYYNYYSNQKDLKDKIVFAFLTRPDREDPKCWEHFVHINYQNIMDRILVPLLGHTSDITALHKIRDYIKTLGISYTQENVMGIESDLEYLVNTLLDENKQLFDILKKQNKEKKEKELLISFWNSNVYNTPVRDILRSVLEVLRLLDKEKYEEYPTRNKRGDATRYMLKNKDENPKDKNGLYQWIVEWYIKQNVESPTIEHLQHIFPSSLHSKASSTRSSRITDNNIVVGFQKNKYSPIQNANGIWICKTGWDGPAMMSRLIRYVKTLKEFENTEILEIPLFLQ